MARKVTLTQSELLAAIQAEHELPPLLPDDVTASRLEKKGLYHGRAYWEDVLTKGVAAGKWIVVMCYDPDTKRPVRAYRLP